jgi:hypothetical protein
MNYSPKYFNDLGEKGWELVTAVKETGLTPTYVFKRLKRRP